MLTNTFKSIDMAQGPLCTRMELSMNVKGTCILEYCSRGFINQILAVSIWLISIQKDITVHLHYNVPLIHYTPVC